MNQYRLATRDVDWLNPKSKAADRPGQDTEILFIEQCWNYLDRGRLSRGRHSRRHPHQLQSAIRPRRNRRLLPYRRRRLLPQTAFTATGAGGEKFRTLPEKAHHRRDEADARHQAEAQGPVSAQREKLEQYLGLRSREEKPGALRRLGKLAEFATIDAC